MSEIAITYPINEPRVDFQKREYDTIIYQKGRKVLFEKAIQCPCKSRSTNQQSNCKNCGGAGWLYINPKTERFLITGLSITNDYKPWSEEARGVINITAHDYNELSFMDRITLLDANSIHQEVVFLKKSKDQNKFFFYTAYPIKKLLYGGIFISVSAPLQRIEQSEFEINGNVVKINLPSSLISSSSKDDEISITLRYYHAPIYYILEMKRDTMQSFRVDFGEEVIQNLPVSCFARRGHYLLNSPNLDGTRLIDNSYDDRSEKCSHPILESCPCCQTNTSNLITEDFNNIQTENQINIQP